MAGQPGIENPDPVFGPGKERSVVKARMLVCHWAVKDLGMTMTETARRLDIAVPTVSIAVKKGKKIIHDEGLSLAAILDRPT